MRTFLTLLLSVSWVFAAMPIVPVGIETKCDTILNDVVTHARERQQDYLDSNGNYWQGILTHGTVPKDGEKSAPTKSAKPTNQVEDWTAFGVPLPDSMECAISINVVEGTKGKGWHVIGRIKLGDDIWEKSIQGENVEAYQLYDWRKEDATR